MKCPRGQKQRLSLGPKHYIRNNIFERFFIPLRNHLLVAENCLLETKNCPHTDYIITQGTEGTQNQLVHKVIDVVYGP